MQTHVDHTTEAAGTALGFIAGVYKSITIFGMLTWSVFFDSVLLSAACAIVGLFIGHFGKKLFKKLGW